MLQEKEKKEDAEAREEGHEYVLTSLSELRGGNNCGTEEVRSGKMPCIT